MQLGGFLPMIMATGRNVMKFLHVIESDLFYVHAENHCIWQILWVKKRTFLKNEITCFTARAHMLF